MTNSSKVTQNLENPKITLKKDLSRKSLRRLKSKKLKEKSKGFIYKNIRYKSFNYKILGDVKRNTWIELDLFEGKKNEIRQILDL